MAGAAGEGAGRRLWLIHFSQAKKNPYPGRLKNPVTIRLEEGTVAYFKALADALGIPYQTLINLYLRDCASSGRRLNMAWKPGN